MRTSSLNIFNIWLRFLSRCFKEVSTPFIWRMWDMRYEIWDLRKGNEIWEMRYQIFVLSHLGDPGSSRTELEHWGEDPDHGQVSIRGHLQQQYLYYQTLLFNTILIWNIDIISIGYSILFELYERDSSQKERNNKNNGTLPFWDGQDREYQLDVARADVYIHSIHFPPVR